MPRVRTKPKLHLAMGQSGGTMSRFKLVPKTEPTPRSQASLREDHHAVIEERTLFPSRVFDASERDHILMRGFHNSKIGDRITKGPWAGFPIYTVTLEERATCPRSCAVYRECFAPGTKILKADLQWVPVESLSVGESLIGFDVETGGAAIDRRKTRVSDVQAIGRATFPSYRVVTDRGEFTSSGGHLWLGKQRRERWRWVRTDALKFNDKIQFFAPPWEQEISYGAGRVRGFIEGEGSVVFSGTNGYAKPSVSWGQRPGKLLNEINDLVRQRGFRLRHHHVTSGINGSDIINTSVLGGWREVLRFLGVFRPTRLMEKIEGCLEDHVLDGCYAKPARVLSIEPLGDLEVVTIATSTKTLIANGFSAHNCYGNALPFAARFRYNEAFLASLEEELVLAGDRHHQGFAVRAHVLGDFVDLEYLQHWRLWMDMVPALHVWGYTAHQLGTPIGDAVRSMNDEFPNRWAFRQSVAPGTGSSDWQASTTWEKPHKAGGALRSADGLICPAEMGATDTCGTCGLCWSPAAKKTRIVFLGHGMRRSVRSSKTDANYANPIPETRKLPSERFTDVDAFIAAHGVTRLPPAKARGL